MGLLFIALTLGASIIAVRKLLRDWESDIRMDVARRERERLEMLERHEAERIEMRLWRENVLAALHGSHAQLDDKNELPS